MFFLKKRGKRELYLFLSIFQPALMLVLFLFILFSAGCRDDGTSDHFFGGGASAEENTPLPSWKMAGDIDFMFRPGRAPILYFNYLVPHIAFIDEGNFSKVSVGRFDGFLWRTVNSGGASFSSAAYHSFVIYKNTLYCAYTESSLEDKISVIGFINGAWEYVGAPGFTHKKANYLDFKISDHTNDKFYIAYCNGDNLDRPYAYMRYGADWKQLGAAAISSAQAKEIKLAVLDGTPYAAYIEKTAANRISAVKYNKALEIWEHIGGQAFSSQDASYLNFREINGALYIAYCDGMANSRVKVSVYDGVAWKNISGEGVSDGPASDCALADYNGVLYIAFRDFTNEKRVTVMSNQGGKWGVIGRRDFSSDDICDISLSICQKVPYLAYRDKKNSDKIMVWKYE